MNTTKLFLLDDGRFLINIPCIGKQIAFKTEADPFPELVNYSEDEIASFEEVVWDSTIESIVFNASLPDDGGNGITQAELKLVYALVIEKVEDSDAPKSADDTEGGQA